MRVLSIAYCVLLMGALVACRSQAPAGPKIQVKDAWSRPATAARGSSHGGGGSTGVVYLTLINEGGEADRLLSAWSEVAEVVEIHRTTMEAGVMRMQPITEGVEVPARGRLEFKPGGYHLMLIKLKQDLQAGDKVPVVLRFEKSGEVVVEAEVRQP